MKTTIKKRAGNLAVGDVLASTGMKVAVAPQAGLKTPTGKCEIVFEYPNGDKILKVWSKSMEVAVISN